MTPNQLAARCVKAMNFWKDDPEKASITIVLQKGWKAPPKFPRRTLLCENSKTERVYSVNAMDVLAWLAANGFVEVASSSG